MNSADRYICWNIYQSFRLPLPGLLPGRLAPGERWPLPLARLADGRRARNLRLPPRVPLDASLDGIARDRKRKRQPRRGCRSGRTGPRRWRAKRLTWPGGARPWAETRLPSTWTVLQHYRPVDDINVRAEVKTLREQGSWATVTAGIKASMANEALPQIAGPAHQEDACQSPEPRLNH